MAVASPGQLWLRRVRGRGAAAGHSEFCGHRESLVPESLSSGRRVLRRSRTSAWPERGPPGCLLVTRQNRRSAQWDRRAVLRPGEERRASD